MDTKPGQFFALSRDTRHAVARKGIVPNSLKWKHPKAYSLFVLLLEERQVQERKVTHEMSLDQRRMLWKEVQDGLLRFSLIQDKDVTNYSE